MKINKYIVFFCTATLLQESTTFGNTTGLGYPSFQTPDAINKRSSFKKSSKKYKKRRKRKHRKSSRILSDIAIGLGMNIPDIIPIEFYYKFSPYFSFRGFLALKIPFNIRVELPADELSSSNGFIVENPDLNVTFKAHYGPQYGLEFMYFPWGENFYCSLGASFRKLAINGGTESNLILRSADRQTAVSTNTTISLHADADTSQYVVRSTIGYFVKTANRIYMNFYLGYTKPYKASSNIDITGNIFNPNLENAEHDSATREWIASKELELEDEAEEAIKPAEKLALPIIGLSMGIFL